MFHTQLYRGGHFGMLCLEGLGHGHRPVIFQLQTVKQQMLHQRHRLIQ